MKRKSLTTNSLSTKSDKLILPKWAKVSGKIFNEILSTNTKAKNNGLKINADRREITPDKAESLLKDVGSGETNGHEFKEKYNDVINDVILILDKSSLIKNQNNMVKI